MKYCQTSDFSKSMKKVEGKVWMIDKLSEASSYEEMMILCELNGFTEKIDFDVFMVMFGFCLSETCDNKKLIEIIIETAEKTKLLDHIFNKKQFWNMCGRWIRYNYNKKDKSLYCKLSILMGIAGKKTNLCK